MSLEGALRLTELSVRLVCTWPPSRDATKWQMIRADLAWCVSFLSVLFLLLPLMRSIYEYRSDPIILTQSTGLACACVMIMTKTLVLRVHREKCQVSVKRHGEKFLAFEVRFMRSFMSMTRKMMIDDMEDFVKTCLDHERQLLQSYVDGCWLFYGGVTLMNYLACIPVIFGPFVFPEQPMPTFAVYPFPVDSGLVMCLVFVHQSIVGFQTSAGLTIDCQVALVMWYAGARLEILAQEISDHSSLKDLPAIVKKHQQLLAYANRISGTMCYIALTSACICGVSTVMGTMQLVADRPFVVKMQYGPATLVSLVNLLVCAWPAENMIRVTCLIFLYHFHLPWPFITQCNLIGTRVYNVPWVDNTSTTFTKDVIMILRRAQRPVCVTVGGFLPALSFRFYASFLSSVFSYFTTVRLLIKADVEN